MDFSPDEMRLLAGKEFNALLAADPELIRLNGLRHDKTRDAHALLEVLGLGDWRIGALPVRPLTAAKWAFLAMLESPFVTGGPVGPADVDVMLYILSVPDLRDVPCALHEIPAAASGFRLAPGLADREVRSEIGGMIGTAFRPLGMLTADAQSGTPRYDAVWLTGICGIAARESGMPLDACMHRLSLSACCALFVAWRRREEPHAVRTDYRTPAEAAEMIDARMDQLAEEFLRTKR